MTKLRRQVRLRCWRLVTTLRTRKAHSPRHQASQYFLTKGRHAKILGFWPGENRICQGQGRREFPEQWRCNSLRCKRQESRTINSFDSALTSHVRDLSGLGRSRPPPTLVELTHSKFPTRNSILCKTSRT